MLKLGLRLVRLKNIRYISARRQRRLDREAEEDATDFPKPISINNECISILRDGLSEKYVGKINEEFKNPEFKLLLSNIFDKVYKDIGIRMPKSKASNPEYRLYKIDELEKVIK